MCTGSFARSPIGEDLLDAFAQLGAVVAQVRRVQPAHWRRRATTARRALRGWRRRWADRSGRSRRRTRLASSPSATIACIALISAAVAGRSPFADDELAHRAEADVGQQVDGDAVLLELAEVAVEVGPRRRRRSPALSRGAIESDSPITSVVTPWRILLWALPSVTSGMSECECMSMKPGASTRPRASIVRVPLAGAGVADADDASLR